MLPALFGMATYEQLDSMTKQWAIESKNILMLAGKDFNLDPSLAFVKLISKCFVGGNAKIVESQDKNVISMVIRHTMAENTFFLLCSMFCGTFFSLLALKAASVEHDPSTIFVRLEMATDEI